MVRETTMAFEVCSQRWATLAFGLNTSAAPCSTFVLNSRSALWLMQTTRTTAYHADYSEERIVSEKITTLCTQLGKERKGYQWTGKSDRPSAWTSTLSRTQAMPNMPLLKWRGFLKSLESQLPIWCESKFNKDTEETKQKKEAAVWLESRWAGNDQPLWRSQE